MICKGEGTKYGYLRGNYAEGAASKKALKKVFVWNILEQQRGQGVSGRVNGTVVASEIIDVMRARLCRALLSPPCRNFHFYF